MIIKKRPSGLFTINRNSPQANGIIGWYPMLASRGANRLINMSHLSGPVAFPASAADPTWAGSDLLFATDDYISWGDVYNLGLNNMSYGIWLKRTNATANQIYGILGKTRAGWGWRYAQIFEGTNIISLLDFNNDVHNVVVSEAAYLNTLWHHFFTIINRAGNHDFYIDVGFVGSNDI
jgi:hypothetical protein